MQSASSSFSFPPARNPRPSRPRPDRSHSHHSTSSHKAAPYHRPNAPASSSSSPADAKWQHDLFGSSSDLYKPAINVQQLAKLIPGSQPHTSAASLRPFGDATPAPQRLISTPSNPVTSDAPPQEGGGRDLMTRLGIKGSSNERQERARLERSEKVRIDRERREQARVRKLLEREYAERLAIAQFEASGHVVQVEGLVFGTSGEDVQTAFGSYGEIKHCFIVNDKTARDGDQLTARITFSLHEDAKTACHKLDGAIADGRPLRVHHVPRSPFPKALPPLVDNAVLSPSASAGVATQIPAGPRGGPAGRGRGRVAPSSVVSPAVPAPAPIPSKMYADSIAEAYAAQPLLPAPIPSVGGSDSMMMDVETGDSRVPTGPRRGRGGGAAAARDGTRAGHAVLGRVQQPQPPLAAAAGGAPTSLLARMNGAGTRGAATANGNKGQAAPSGPKSLAERLGQTTATHGNGSVPGANARRRGGKGSAAMTTTTTTTKGANSLLQRLQ